MSVADVFDDSRGAVAWYGERIADLIGADELVGGGRPRAASADLAATIDLLGTPGLLARRAETMRLVEDDGVTYGSPRRTPDSPPGRGGPGRWRLDPLPVVLSTPEWQVLEAGVRQRVELLDLVLTDLYGPRELLRRGIVPPEVVLGHPGFVRAADQIRLPGPHQLSLTAVDVGRDSGGGWTVVADRTQAPSGAGYAMENRRIVSRVMPALYRDTRLDRLRTFFHTVRAGLQEVAPATSEAPRVVMLTPGPGSETAFDQSFLSTLLGYPVVSGEDLTVREGRVYLRALGRLEPVDVVVRRVDAWFCDPLELHAESRLGVPGLLEAARLGTVSVVNPFGAGVLENPGLLPFLPAASLALLGEPLELPSAATWWCGDPASRSHVLDQLDRLVFKPIARGVGRGSLFGWELSAARRDDLRRRIEAAPYAWCAQEPVSLSTAPVVTPRGLEPRRMVLRTFAAAAEGGYHVMAGGLARVAGRADSVFVSSVAGALAKDVWVLSPSVIASETLADVSPARLTQPVAPGATRPSTRVAEDLFWLGRYAERAEDTVRLLRVIDDLAEDWTSRPDTPGHQALRVLLRTLTEVTTTFPGFTGPGAEPLLAAPQPELLSLVVDAGRPGSLAQAVGRTVESAHAVREQLSLDTWIVLGSLDRVLDELRLTSGHGVVERPLQPPLARMLEALVALAGLGAESMVRDIGWHYLDAGRRIERALQLTSLLWHALAVGPYPTAVEAQVLESTLIAGESIITYRRRQQRRPRPGAVVELLMLDRLNPRAVTYQLDRLADNLRYLPEPEEPPPGPGLADRLAGVVARIREIDASALDAAGPGAARRREGLPSALAGVHAALSELAVAFTSVHFVHGAPQRSITGTPGVVRVTGSVGRTYLVRHRTEYAYEEKVTASYGRAYLTPRDVPGQWTRRSGVQVDPEPSFVQPSEDYFGNPSVYVEVHTEHTRLVVTAESEVEVRRDVPDLAALDGAGGWTWDQVRGAVTGWPAAPADPSIDPVMLRQFLLPSPQVAFPPEVRAYARSVFRPGRGAGEAVRDLVRSIHADFAYRPGTTTVTTPLRDVLRRREGVCQDFAHLAVACLRVSGLPARYVSGYLETQPPPGRPKLAGADASHAWASVLLPELGWVDLDPTNDKLVDDDYVVTAWGRDYTDVPPLKGVIFTESSRSTMKVAVDVLRLDTHP